jgi:hypothetical protein
MALASHLPLTAAINFGTVEPAERDQTPGGALVDFASVDPTYFEAMGIPLLAGRSRRATAPLRRVW